MIIREPKVLESKSRCETSYRLLEFDNGRFAIEWEPWYGEAYAVMYDDLKKTTEFIVGIRNTIESCKDVITRPVKDRIMGNF
jgi:hypothetical protein